MKFRKKPVLVDAVQYTPGLEDGYACYEIGGRFVGYYAKTEPLPRVVRKPAIMTALGYREVEAGDWIVTDAGGGRWPCGPDVFAQTYEPADGPTHEDETYDIIRQRYADAAAFANDPAGGDPAWDGGYICGIEFALNALGVKITEVNA